MAKRYDDEPILRRFGAAVRQRREAIGLSREAFAAALGTDAKNLYRLEAGTENVGLMRATRIASALGVSLHDLVCGADDHAALGRTHRSPSA